MVTHVDVVLIKFSIFGRYYLKCLTLISIALLCSCTYSNNYVFAAMKVGYRCVDERFGNDSCASLSNSTDVCAEWVYDDPHSFVAEFQLACQEWKRTLIGSVHYFGYMIGLMIIGPLSDRIGRKNVLIITGTLCAIMGVAKSFVTYYWVYIVFEFIESNFVFSSPLFLLLTETVSNEKRVFCFMLSTFGYAIGYLALPLAAWGVSYWRHMLLVLYSPAVLLFILCFFLMDESPRWLLSKRRNKEAVTVLQKIAKITKVELDKNEIENLKDETTVDSITFKQLIKDTISSTILLKRFIICVTWWIASTFVNYGLQINSVSLPGNKYVNFSYMCITEILGLIMLTYFISRFKRKRPLVFCFSLAAVLCSCQAFTPKQLPWLSVLLYMSGKLLASMFFNITYIYTSELFPTHTRNCMHGLCSSLGRIGSIIAPQASLLMSYWQGLPSLIFGTVSLAAGMITLLAPNTADHILPDTVLQAEAIGQKQIDRRRKYTRDKKK